MKDDISYKISAVRIFTTDFHRSKDFYVNIFGFDLEAYGAEKGGFILDG
ncbi:VOC family protein [candidate division KSB1 bacterium]|nr:VOC family protein [candidate division KSB1 bacterium]